MAENKTKPTRASVEGYLDAIEDETRRKDCDFLVKLMTKITRSGPQMWGPSIVGFGHYRYKYESGREGEACVPAVRAFYQFRRYIRQRPDSATRWKWEFT